MGIVKINKSLYFVFGIAFFFLTIASFAQNTKPAFSFCGKSVECTMTWDEFMACKKELTPIDKNTSISSFVLTIRKAEKKDFIFLEFPSKGNAFSKASIEMIEKLHKEKKLGEKLEIDAVELVQSGKAAKKVSGMIIILN